ncbi:hypothetical protein [Adhaeribacter pallidiroseus]|uniref:Uncharacterized protein n=1 Tax=Adhaeribacter pallidiroseus TaxID=2072847 RepID=A0A369QDS9_9BACT|nr:hypothetical protein [Adhaeribacter pallidiroseus]RDC62874.1 hypothetical protein AHMF7616_01473 [Adhaeribacter pallidiroseus]
MKKVCLLCKGSSRVLVALLILVVLSTVPAVAQKIKNDKIRTTYRKSPVVMLTPKYSSFSIEYDYGDMVVPVGEKPKLQGLKYQKADGDLTLKMRIKNVYSADKTLQLDDSGGKKKAYYNVTYKADYGYDLVDKATGDIIASYQREGGVFSTPSFSSQTEMDIYMKNALVSDLTKYLVEKVHSRVDYDLTPSTYEVRLVTNILDGTIPAYQEINQATTSFATAIATAEPDKEKLQQATTVWENHLKKVNWTDKKSEINKKVGIALVENLCAAYLLLEDYPKLALAAELAESKNKGILADLSNLTFEIDSNYLGPCTFTKTTIKNGKITRDYKPTFMEFAGDLVAKE